MINTTQLQKIFREGNPVQIKIDGGKNLGTLIFRLRILPSGKKSATWETHYYITGKRKKLLIGQVNVNNTIGMTLKDARDYFREIVSPIIQSGKDPKVEIENNIKEEKNKNITFSLFFTQIYSPIAVKNKKPRTFKNEKSYFQTWIYPAIGEKRLEEIKLIDIELLKNKMIDEKKSQRTIQQCIGIIRHIFNFAILHEYYDKQNPCAKIKIKQPDNQKKRYFTEKQINTLVVQLAKTAPESADLVLFAVYTGARFGETAALEWQDINFKQNTITFRGETTKPADTRIIPLIPELKQLLWQRKVYTETQLVFPSTKKTIRKSPPVTIVRAINKLGFNKQARNNLEKLTYHSLRHTAASWMVQQGVDLYLIGQILGHKNLKTTKRYSHLSNENLKNAMSKLSRKITQE